MHESSNDHIINVTKWLEMRRRLQGSKTFDDLAQREINRERAHWQAVLTRILASVQYLSQNTLAFRGTNAKLYEPNNGNFLGLIEIIAKFDPTIQEHIRRVKNNEIHDHYFGPSIQNEIISMMANNVKNAIIHDVKTSKYFAVILDCTPDMSHQEQMSLVLRFVNMTSQDVSIREHFLDFIQTTDQTGQGLSDSLLASINRMGLLISDCRGQGYDNGANMKGQSKGVQARILRLNPRAFFTHCGCHSLNLVLGDMARSCPKAMTFFGVVQRIYTLFASSTKRWQTLKTHSSITPKPLSNTRWECRTESVKAIRYQTSQIRDALQEMKAMIQKLKAKLSLL